MQVEPTPHELRESLCWEDVDRVPNQPDVTAFKRRARLQQARWRERRGTAMGTHPYSGQGSAVRSIGSRISSEEGKKDANFLTPQIARAAEDRVNASQRLQTLNNERLYCDLLSSMPMCFNLFGSFAFDNEKATKAVRAWMPDCPGKVERIIFEWSPGRGDANYLGNRSAFDAAFILDLGGDAKGILGFETKYHEHLVGVPLARSAETARGQAQLARYEQVARTSGVFSAGTIPRLRDGPLSQIWLDHLLLLSMLTNPEKWAWGRFCLVYPQANPSFSAASKQYSQLLSKDGTFAALTLEQMVAADALDPEVRLAFKSRYLWK
jgi:hypothetical protein